MKEKEQMSIKEAERLSVMQQIDKKILTIVQASRELNMSLRQAKRVRKRYVNQGAPGLISLKRGKPSNRKIKQAERDRVIELIKTQYADFGPTLASEKLNERNGIKISSETLRQWLIEEGLWKPKGKKAVKVYQRRMRRSRFGELLQADGSPHDWFQGRAEKCTLLQFVDDATTKTTVALFAPNEGTDEYLELLEMHLKMYGRPLAFYTDKHTSFRVNKEELKESKGITHFGQVVKELGIELICAHSPQAKGRVERKNGVFQDRLIKEMRLRGISTIEEANKFLPQFLEEINQRFGKAPTNPEDAHRVLREQDDLRRIFARKDRRKLSKDLTFQYESVLYLIKTKSPNRMRYAQVDVLKRAGEPIEVEYQGIKLEYKKWSEEKYEKPLVLNSKEIETKILAPTKRHKPSKHHPWR